MEKLSSSNWPTFNGVRLTARERKSGKLITKIYDGDPAAPFDPNGISRDQLWMDRKGTIYFELRYGLPPLETANGRSVLTPESVQALNAEACQIKGRVTEIVASDGEPMPASPEKPYQVILEKRSLPRFDTNPTKNKVA